VPIETPPPAGVQRAIDPGFWRCSRARRSISATFRSTIEAAPDFTSQGSTMVARTIPPGQTMTYGEIAKKLGAPHESREGRPRRSARNPVAIIVPLPSRAVAPTVKMGGFFSQWRCRHQAAHPRDRGARRRSAAGPLFDRLK